MGERAGGPWIGYVLTSAAALYTLYYAAWLIAAQAVLALWLLRRDTALLRRLLVAWFTIFLLFLPWLVYALPPTDGYVSQKVASDQDRPLWPCRISLASILRAFFVGHVASQDVRVLGGLGVALAGLCLIGAGLFMQSRKMPKPTIQQPSPDRALLLRSLCPLAWVSFSICDCPSSPTAASA